MSTEECEIDDDRHRIDRCPGGSAMTHCPVHGYNTGRCNPNTPMGAPRAEVGQRTRAIIAAGKLTLDRQERHDLAELLVDHAGSWRTLSEDDARRIADALDAFLAVQALLRMRRLHRL